jgi:hypothetical protein
MKAPCDHDLRIWVDAPTYLALHHLAVDDDRALSEYCRHVLISHLKQVSARVAHLNSGAPAALRDGEGR